MNKAKKQTKTEGRLEEICQKLVQQSLKARREQETVVNTASSITDDPILRDMLVDTARTTLPNQLNADRSTPNVTQTIAGRPGADKAAVLAESANPEDLFGEEAAGKWASLAFGG